MVPERTGDKIAGATKSVGDYSESGDYSVGGDCRGWIRAVLLMVLAGTLNATVMASDQGKASFTRRSPLANSDPNYQALRNGKPIHVHRVANLVLNRDAGVFTFRSGSFSFLPAVKGCVTVGVFVGEGNLQLNPRGDLAALRMKRMMGAEAVNEDFTAVVVFFSDSTFDEIEQHSELVDESPGKHEEALKRVRSVIRDRREPRLPPSWPRSEMEMLLNWENIPNYEAEVLAEAYNGAGNRHAGSFRAFLHGKKYGDLRFLMNPHSALPVLHAREEVALLDFDPNSNSDGIWYLAHTPRPEGRRGTNRSS